MKQRHFLIFLLIVVVNMVMSTECNKEVIAINPSYEFLEKLTLTPYKKIYSINDTIWVQFQTADKSLYDKISNSRISTDTTFLQVGFYYHKLYNIGTAPEFFCDVNVDNSFNPEFTTLYAWYNLLNISTGCNSIQYFFKVGFIPKKTGIYSIEPNITLVNCANKIIQNYSTSRFIFDLADCNKDVWLSIPPASRGGELGFTDVSIDKKEIFVFQVE